MVMKTTARTRNRKYSRYWDLCDPLPRGAWERSTPHRRRRSPWMNRQLAPTTILPPENLLRSTPPCNPFPRVSGSARGVHRPRETCPVHSEPSRAAQGSRFPRGAAECIRAPMIRLHQTCPPAAAPGFSPTSAPDQSWRAGRPRRPLAPAGLRRAGKNEGLFGAPECPPLPHILLRGRILFATFGRREDDGST